LLRFPPLTSHQGCHRGPVANLSMDLIWKCLFKRYEELNRPTLAKTTPNRNQIVPLGQNSLYERECGRGICAIGAWLTQNQKPSSKDQGPRTGDRQLLVYAAGAAAGNSWSSPVVAWLLRARSWNGRNRFTKSALHSRTRSPELGVLSPGSASAVRQHITSRTSCKRHCH